MYQVPTSYDVLMSRSRYQMECQVWIKPSQAQIAATTYVIIVPSFDITCICEHSMCSLLCVMRINVLIYQYKFNF